MIMYTKLRLLLFQVHLLLIVPLLIVPIDAISANTQNQVIKAAQEKLKASGYYLGPVDGLTGPKLRSAIENFQRDNALPVTGKLDTKTVGKLGVDNRSSSDAIEKLASDALLLTSLCQALQRDPEYGHLFFKDEKHIRAAQWQLKNLLTVYELSADSCRNAFKCPEGVFIKWTGELDVFVSDKAWFDPLAINYLSRGSFPKIEFRYPGLKAGYSLQFSGVSYIPIFEEGLEAIMFDKHYVFRDSKWRLVSQ